MSPRGGESQGPEVDRERRSVGGGHGGGGAVAEAGPPGSVTGTVLSALSRPGCPWRVVGPEKRTLLVTWFGTEAGLSSPKALMAFTRILLSPAGRLTLRRVSPPGLRASCMSGPLPLSLMGRGLEQVVPLGGRHRGARGGLGSAAGNVNP